LAIFAAILRSPPMQWHNAALRIAQEGVMEFVAM
jgi:hypothetical protein